MNLDNLMTRIRASVTFRAKRRFRQAIAFVYQGKLARQGRPNHSPNKPLSNLRVMFFAGREQVEMLHQALMSIEQGWAVLPRLLLVSDGTISPEEFRQSFSWWSNELTVVNWEDFAQPAAARGRDGLVELAKRNILGRKLCAILESALEGDTLFSDTDVLWFKGPPPLQVGVEPATLKLARDIQGMYDMRLLAEMKCSELTQELWLNTGVCFAKGDIYAEAGLHEIMEAAARNPHYFSEQTILSLACKRLGGQSWARGEIYLGIKDQVRWPTASFPGQDWSARHYPGDVRHWFWVDAYFLQAARRKDTAHP